MLYSCLQVLLFAPIVLLVAGVPPTLGTSPFRSRFQPFRLNATRSPVRIITRPKPVQSAPAVINATRCGVILNGLPSKSFRFRRPVCLRLNESQLLQRLKDVGGWNPRYMAINREHTCQFTDIAGVDSLSIARNSSDPVQPALARQKRTSRQRRGISIRGCWSAGFESNNLVRLCTECSATTQLPSNVFPPFINEAICEGDSCHRDIGRCIQRVINFTFLRRTGIYMRDDNLSESRGINIYVEKTTTFQQDVRACCECQVHPFIFGRR